VPAGVPTTAPYQEPGDVAPKFTLAMFDSDQIGALDAAKYYLEARNWADALEDAKPFIVICDAKKCKDDARNYARARTARDHAVGGRFTTGPPTVVKAPAASHADWIVQVRLAIAAGRLVNASGKTRRSQPSSAQIVNIYLTWNGKMWRVTGDFLAG
jgi:hypothetical protein